MSVCKQNFVSSFLKLLCVAITLIHSSAGSPTHGRSISHLSARQGITSGILLENKSNKQETFYFFKNDANDVGQGETYTMPTVVNPGQTVPVFLDVAWKGHVQRGHLQPSTWVEFQVKDNDAVNQWKPCQGAHGDVSLQRGYDGPATFGSTDPAGAPYHGQWNGITTDILPAAPEALKFTRSDGTKVLKGTLGSGSFAADVAVENWEATVALSPADATNPLLAQSGKLLKVATYVVDGNVVDGNGVPDVGSCNSIARATFY